MAFVLLTVGVSLLLIGGALLVRGASGAAQHFSVPPMIIGLTVVAFGTSMPELVVNISGALSGETDLAFGNAVGSNLANFGLVLGVAAVLSPIHLQGQVVRREVPFLLLITAILMVMAADDSISGSPALLDRGDAIILLMLFSIFIYFIVRDLVTSEGDPVLLEAEHFSSSESNRNLAINLLLSIAGMAGLVFGGNLTIEQGAVIAGILSVPEVVVGIFIVAVGTSLPELITSAIAAYKKENDLALGNIVGSNIFNSLLVLPAAGIIKPLPIPRGGDLDLAVVFVLVLVVIPLFVFSNARLGRTAGLALLLSYAGYMVYRFAI